MTDTILTAEELQRIRARVDAGDIDDLDAGALLDHIDTITASYEDLVRRSAATEGADDTPMPIERLTRAEYHEELRRRTAGPTYNYFAPIEGEEPS